MTKQLRVLLALKALVAAALPGADVRGFDGDTSKPSRTGTGGCVVGNPGDPGDPEIDLSPLTYNYEHAIMLEFAAADGAGGEALDTMIETFGTALAADRTLGGLCSYIAAEAPDRNDRSVAGLATSNWAIVAVVAEYSTTDPLA